MWRITRRITRSLTQTNPSPRQRQQQRQVNRKPSKNTTGHRHTRKTARAAVQRAATNSRPRPHPRHTPSLIAASASGHSLSVAAQNGPCHRRRRLRRRRAGVLRQGRRRLGVGQFCRGGASINQWGSSCMLVALLSLLASLVVVPLSLLRSQTDMFGAPVFFVYTYSALHSVR